MRQDIVDQARKYLGVKWVHQGRARRSGLDCLGLVVVVLEDLGYSVEDNTTYRRLPDDRLLLREVYRQFPRVEGDSQPGDVALLHFEGRRKSPYHFGIITEKGTMIHGYAPARKVVESLIDPWLPQIHSVFRAPEL